MEGLLAEVTAVAKVHMAVEGAGLETEEAKMVLEEVVPMEVAMEDRRLVKGGWGEVS